MAFAHVIAIILMAEKVVAFERNLAFEKKVQATVSTARRVEARELQVFANDDGSKQCGVDLVSGWIGAELQKRTCDDLPLDSISLPICRQYEAIEDVSECDNLTPDSVGFNTGGIGSTREECEVFVSALQPNSYFRDIDNLNHVFGTTGSFPTRHECFVLQDQTCELHVVYAPQDETMLPGETSAPTPAPYSVPVACTRCDYFYQVDEVCFNADCSLYNCTQNNQSNSGNQQRQVDPPANHSQDALIADYHKLNHDNNTAVSCPSLKHGEVDCQQCLASGCAAAEGQCLISCLVVGNVPCWSHELFTENTTEELCHYKAEREADYEICGSVNITDCATCTSTIKSDGVSPCEWYFSRDGHSHCDRGGCDLFGMCGRKTCDVEPTDASELGEINPFCDAGECIGVCFKSYRSDLFSFREERKGDSVGCSMKTEQKSWTTEFHRGSTNVRKLEFKIGERYSSPEDVEDGGEYLDYCELVVDGVTCSRCAFCGALDLAELDLDCSNIVPGAITSCGSLQDLYFGIVHKLLFLVDGATHEPSRAPSLPPAPNPTEPESQVEIHVEGPTGGVATESETNEIIGFASSGTRVAMTELLFLGTSIFSSFSWD